MENMHFITKLCHHQTYQNHEMNRADKDWANFKETKSRVYLFKKKY